MGDFQWYNDANGMAPRSLSIPMGQSDNQRGGTQVLQFNNDTSFDQLPETNMYPPNLTMLQQSGIGINTPPYPIEGDTMMADAGTMSGCLSAPGEQHSENLTCPVTVAKRRGGSKMKTSKEEGPKNRDEKWEPWRETLKYLKLDQGHTFPEVAFEMSSIHGFKFAVSTYQKLGDRWEEFRSEKAKDKSSRHGRPGKSARTSIGIIDIFRCKVDAQRYLSDNRLLQVPSVFSEPYVYQYKILHAIDSLVKILFDKKGRYKWSASRTKLTISDQSLENTATKSLVAWESLFDKCRGIEAFYEGHAMQGTFSRLKTLFDRVLWQVKETKFLCDPHMLLYIWKVCDTLMSVILDGEIWVKKYILVGAFLQSLRLRLRELGFKGSDHLMVLVDSLFSILNSTPLDLKKSLGLGCWKFMEILGSQIGNDHFVILNLGMYCNRTWGNIWGLVDVEELQARYKHYLPLTNAGYGAPVTITAPEHQGASISDEQLERIEMLHMSGLALNDVMSTLKAKRSDDRTRVSQITSLLNLTDRVCLGLVNLTRGPCSQEVNLGKLKYTKVTRALAFALEQLAFDLHEKATTEELDVRKRKKIRKQRNAARKRDSLGQSREGDPEALVRFSTNPGDIANIYRFMDEAIEILRKGDKDCKLRAAQLSRQLMSWMKTYRQGEIQANRRGRSKGQYYKNERDRAREILASIFPGEKIESRKKERIPFHEGIVKDANMKEAKTVQVVVRPRRSREKKVDKAPTPLPLEDRTCLNCKKVFKSRNRLFEEHVKVAGACRPSQQTARDEPVMHQPPDPFMGWPYQGELE